MIKCITFSWIVFDRLFVYGLKDTYVPVIFVYASVYTYVLYIHVMYSTCYYILHYVICYYYEIGNKLSYILHIYKFIYVLLSSFQCHYLVLLYSYFLPMYIHCMYTM